MPSHNHDNRATQEPSTAPIKIAHANKPYKDRIAALGRMKAEHKAVFERDRALYDDFYMRIQHLPAAEQEKYPEARAAVKAIEDAGARLQEERAKIGNLIEPALIAAMDQIARNYPASVPYDPSSPGTLDFDAADSVLVGRAVVDCFEALRQWRVRELDGHDHGDMLRIITVDGDSPIKRIKKVGNGFKFTPSRRFDHLFSAVAEGLGHGSKSLPSVSAATQRAVSIYAAAAGFHDWLSREAAAEYFPPVAAKGAEVAERDAREYARDAGEEQEP